MKVLPVQANAGFCSSFAAQRTSIPWKGSAGTGCFEVFSSMHSQVRKCLKLPYEWTFLLYVCCTHVQPLPVRLLWLLAAVAFPLLVEPIVFCGFCCSNFASHFTRCWGITRKMNALSLMTFSQRKWPGVTFVKAKVHCPWSKLAFLEILHRVIFLTAQAFNLLHGHIRETDHSDGWQSHLTIWDVSRTLPQQVRDHGIGRRGIRTADKQVSHGKNSLEQKGVLDLHAALEDVCRRVMEIRQFGKFARKIGKTSVENVHHICGTFLNKFRPKRPNNPRNSGKAITEMPVHFSLCVLGATTIGWLKNLGKIHLGGPWSEPINHLFRKEHDPNQTSMRTCSSHESSGVFPARLPVPRWEASKEDSMLRGLDP